MNTRFGMVVVTVTLVALTSGCSGMRNFLFGRGARCGACNAPANNETSAAPCQTCPSDATCSAPGACYNGDAYGSAYAGSAYVGSGCGCNVSDPYTNGAVLPYEGQIIDEVVVPGTMSPSDGFGPRPAPVPAQ